MNDEIIDVILKIDDAAKANVDEALTQNADSEKNIKHEITVNEATIEAKYNLKERHYKEKFDKMLADKRAELEKQTDEKVAGMRLDFNRDKEKIASEIVEDVINGCID